MAPAARLRPVPLSELQIPSPSLPRGAHSAPWSAPRSARSGARSWANSAPARAKLWRQSCMRMSLRPARRQTAAFEQGSTKKVWGNQTAHGSAATALTPAFSPIPRLELPRRVPSRVCVRTCSMRCAPQFLVLSNDAIMNPVDTLESAKNFFSMSPEPAWNKRFRDERGLLSIVRPCAGS